MNRSDSDKSGDEDFDLQNSGSGKLHTHSSTDYLVLGDDDESPRAVGAEIYALGKVLKEPLPAETAHIDCEEKEGYLFIQTKLTGDWKRRWCVWKRTHGEGVAQKGYALYYYKDRNQAASFKKPLIKFTKPKDDPRALGVISMTFAHKEAFTTREKEEIMQTIGKQQILPQSKHFVRLSSPTRLPSIAADTDDWLAEWYDLWHTYLNKILEPEPYAFKVAAAVKLEPLVRQQYAVWAQKAANMTKALEANGFFDDVSQSEKRRAKAGTLEMESQKSPGTWKRYRFVLQGRHLYYYNPHAPNKSGTKRVIVLHFATAEEVGEFQDTDSLSLTDGAGGGYMWRLMTPLTTYTLKAPHKVAAEEWIAAIERAKQSRSGKGSRSSSDALLSDVVDDDAGGIYPRNGGAYLTYLIPEARKEKVYKIKKDSIRIGRASTNELTIEDSRLSREHARIDIVNDRLVFVDLGSKRGSKVNHHMCNGRQVLREGDLIKVGRTRMRVFAGKPSK